MKNLIKYTLSFILCLSLSAQNKIELVAKVDTIFKLKTRSFDMKQMVDSNMAKQDSIIILLEKMVKEKQAIKCTSYSNKK